MNDKPKIINLWSSNPPTSNSLSGEETINAGKVGNISVPQLHIYRANPEIDWGAAVIIFPGGGFHSLNLDSMGRDFAVWLSERGITGIVVKYRIPNGIPTIITEDALKALEIVYDKASKWNLSPDKIGVCGYSIGGNTASWLCNNAPMDIKPKFQILFYPVESLKDDFTHIPTRENFIGKHPDSELIIRFSNEMHITPQNPPTFIALSNDDPVVPPIATCKYYTALKKNKVNAAMYIFPTGGHGWTFDSDFEYIELCKELLYKWLKPIVKF
ncbi:MAG: alpha/beta hydrolase [Bacteroidales bacterium]